MIHFAFLLSSGRVCCAYRFLYRRNNRQRGMHSIPYYYLLMENYITAKAQKYSNRSKFLNTEKHSNGKDLKMEHYPQMDIHFPEAKETELHEKMRRRACTPWSPQEHDPHGRPAEKGRYYFHRDVVGDEPSCTVCIWSEKPGHWVVGEIVPDEGQVNPIPIEQYKKILNKFDSEIAEPAVKSINGMTSIGISQYRLEDHFSPEAVKKLEVFRRTPNSNLNDREKWIAFLLQAYDDKDKNDVHCDIFGDCLRTAGWPLKNDIPTLVSEYDFAMQLLKQSGR